MTAISTTLFHKGGKEPCCKPSLHQMVYTCRENLEYTVANRVHRNQSHKSMKQERLKSEREKIQILNIKKSWNKFQRVCQKNANLSQLVQPFSQYSYGRKYTVYSFPM